MQWDSLDSHVDNKCSNFEIVDEQSVEEFYKGEVNERERN